MLKLGKYYRKLEMILLVHVKNFIFRYLDLETMQKKENPGLEVKPSIYIY